MYLGIDCGTQGTKVVILDAEQGAICGEGYASHPLISEANGRREQQPDWWIEALEQAYRQALAQSGIDSRAIRAIGVSGQQHGLVVLDAAGEVIRPAKLWCDTETAPQNAELLERLGGEQGSMDQLGLVLATGYTLSKLLWLKQHEPASFDRIAHILLPHDYINYWLTGQVAAEYGDASGTGYFNVRTRRWVPEVLALIAPDGRLETALPPLLEAHQAVGLVQPAITARLGLGNQVRVSSGGGDNMMGAIGTGNIADGIVTLSLGTSGTIYACTDRATEQDLSADAILVTDDRDGQILQEAVGWTVAATGAAAVPPSSVSGLAAGRTRPGHLSHTRSFCLEFDNQIDWTAFGLWLSMLLNRHGSNILRVKGLLNIAGFDAPVVIQGVQHVVHPPVHLPQWPSADRRSRLVFITRELEQHTIEDSFSVFVNNLQP